MTRRVPTWLLAPLLGLGAVEASIAASVSKSTTCTRRALDLKDCRLKTQAFEVTLSRQKIRIDDRVWKNVYDLPVHGTDTAWHRAEVRRLGDRWLMELLIWDNPEGEIGLQNLKWMVFEILDSKAELKLQKTVGKRRRDPALVQDRPAKYGLRVLNGSRIEWWVDHETGKF